jgi:hypothetical protein
MILVPGAGASTVVANFSLIAPEPLGSRLTPYLVGLRLVRP